MRNCKFYSIVLAVIFAVFFLPGLLFAKDSMTIAVHNYPPYYNKTGKGMMTEVYKAACEAAGIDVEFKVLPVKRGIKYLFQNKIDAFSPGKALLNKQQEQKTAHVHTFNVAGSYMYYDPDNSMNPDFDSLKDLKGHSLATIRNSPLAIDYDSAGIDYTEVKSPVNLIKMVQIGRVDFIDTTLLTGMTLAQKMYKDKMTNFGFFIISSSGTILECTLAFNKANPKTKELLPKFRKGFNTIVENGKYISILEDYWGEGNIQKEALPEEVLEKTASGKYTSKSSLEEFAKYKRNAAGKIVD